MNQILAVFGSMNIKQNRTGHWVDGRRGSARGASTGRSGRARPNPWARSHAGRAIAQSKLAQIMFTFDLARELDPETATANCLHPATYMATTMVRQSGVTPISTVEEGAQAILNLAVADELDGHSGQFYNGLRPSKPNPQAYDDAARERLRVLSLRLTGLA